MNKITTLRFLTNLCIAISTLGTLLVSGCDESGTNFSGTGSKVPEKEYRSAALNRAQQLGKAFAQYATDYEDHLPNLLQSPTLLKPYLPKGVPTIKVPFVPDVKLSHKKRKDIPDAKTRILFYESHNTVGEKEGDAERVVGFVSGEVRTVSGAEWQELRKASNL
jgi:hypothetical protein